MKTMNVLDRVVDSLDVETFIMCQNEEEGKNRLSINERFRF
jgi:hypothetical protein